MTAFIVVFTHMRHRHALTLVGALPFKTDFVYGVVGYGAENSDEPDWTTFGSVAQSSKAPACLAANVSGEFDTAQFGDNVAYGGSMLCFPSSLPMYARLWGSLTATGDICGDLGCKSGAGSIAALMMGRNVIAIDKNEYMVQLPILIICLFLLDNLYIQNIQ